jgi:uncharacterized protein (DUF1501 family)
MNNDKYFGQRISRRSLLGAGLGAVGLNGARMLGVPLVLGQVAQAMAANEASKDRILVVVELSGGNDGLNTLVPFGDDAYYKHRPTLGIKPDKLRKIDDHFGWNSGMAGFEKLYKDGKLAVIHGCGYDQPSFSHFTSMAYLHTAAPNSGEEYGWVGRLGDALQPKTASNFIVNIDATQSLAVKSHVHVPVVFDEPERFTRKGSFQEKPLFDTIAQAHNDANASRAFLRAAAKSAVDASALVREAWTKYRTPVDYGIVPMGLNKISSLIDAGMPTRLYYTGYRNNAFDTHVQQPDLHGRLLTYVSDAIMGFMRDLERIGKADNVSILVMSEFGRRVPENANLGTDHGTANYMFMVGKHVKGGHYGKPVDLTKLDSGDNLIHTTDFRRAYATITKGWMGYTDTAKILKSAFEPFPIFA